MSERPTVLPRRCCVAIPGHVTRVAIRLARRSRPRLAGWSHGRWPAALAALLLLVAGVDPVLAKSSTSGGSLTDTIVEALTTTLRVLFTPVEAFIEQYGNELVALVVRTPYPNAVFTAPTNAPWPAVYDYYWQAVLPLSLSLYGLAIGLVILLESTSHLFSSYHRSKLKRRALVGLFGILSWWWIAAISLRFVNALTGFLVPDLSSVTFFETFSFAAMGVLGFTVASATNLVLFSLIALIYLVRYVTLYLYVLLVPILLVFWIPGVGPFKAVADFMKRFAGFYVPFLFMTLPVALLFRLSWLLAGSFDTSMGGFGAWLVALLLPFLAVAAPLVFLRHASLLFFVGDRAARQMSPRRARQRVETLQRTSRTAVRSTRNFARGVRNRPTLATEESNDGDDDGPRAHRAGRHLRRTGSRLGETVSDRLPRSHSDAGTDGRTGEEGRGGDATDPETGGDDRAHDFDDLRDGTDATDSEDDHPRYIH